MNYLSHLLLSKNYDSSVHLGNFLGDMLRHRDMEGLAEKIKEGVYLHRAIDGFTDSHPIVKEGKSLLYSDFGKYASVVLDVYFDFILIDNWSEFYSTSLRAFLDENYKFIESNFDIIPTRVLKQSKMMVEARWLDGYLSEKGRKDVFMRLDRRAKFTTNFAQAMEVYETKKEALTKIHELFFPELVKEFFPNS